MSAFFTLACEALRDAARRRAIVAAAVASGIAGLAITRCGNCDANIVIQGESLSARTSDLGAVGAILAIGLVAVWTYAVAALLASDGLAAALEDGVAEAVLARPVSRDVFVLARLAGVWLGAFALGALLLALALVSADRPATALLPALRAAVGVAIGTWSVASLAMVVSLSLPRAATLLLFGALGTAVIGIEVAALFGARLSGLVGALAHFGPAWLAGPVGALAPWLAELRLPAPPEWTQARAIAWAVLGTGLLVARFRRLELPR